MGKKRKNFEKIVFRKGEELTNFCLKSNVILPNCAFEKFLALWISEYKINFLYCLSLPGSTWQCGLNYFDEKLQKLQHEEVVLSLGKIIRGGISSVMRDRFAKPGEKKEILYSVANEL